MHACMPTTCYPLHTFSLFHHVNALPWQVNTSCTDTQLTYLIERHDLSTHSSVKNSDIYPETSDIPTESSKDDDLLIVLDELKRKYKEYEKRIHGLRMEIQHKSSQLEIRQRRLEEIDQQEKELKDALLFAVQSGILEQQERLNSIQQSTQQIHQQSNIASEHVQTNEDLVLRGQHTIHQLRTRLEHLKENRNMRGITMKRSMIVGKYKND
jgi:chromosome segregation ATPase